MSNIPDYFFQLNYTTEYVEYYGLPPDHVAFSSSIYMIVTTIVSLLYIRIVMIIVADKSLYALPAYKIIVHLGIADIIQLSMHFAAGFFIIFTIEYSNRFEFWIGKIAGSIITLGWFGSAFLTLLLAFNRFVQNIFDGYADYIFSKTKLKIYLAICWLLAAPIPIICLTPVMSRHLLPYWTQWLYNGQYPNKSTIFIFRSLTNFTMLGIILFITVVYVIIIIYLIIMKTRHTTQKASFMIEMRLTIQTAIICFYATLAVCYMQWIESSINAAHLSILYYTQLLATLTWVLLAGINPIVYLIFNKRIRSQFLPEKYRKTIKKTTTITVQVKPSTRVVMLK